MLAKEIPISEIAIPAVIQANLAGADLVMLAGPNHRPGQKLMVKPEIKNREDLKGKRLGVTRFGTSDDFLLRYILSQWGIQPDREVALIQMGGSQEILAGLSSRGIDGGMISSPLNLRVPYPTMKGIRLVLDEIAARSPKARDIAPDSLIDLSYLKEIDGSGFIKSLYEK
jgi:ABC-type nitrate/sulfonate/bicarbonate transport system substrate-binding protein